MKKSVDIYNTTYRNRDIKTYEQTNKGFLFKDLHLNVLVSHSYKNSEIFNKTVCQKVFRLRLKREDVRHVVLRNCTILTLRSSLG